MWVTVIIGPLAALAPARTTTRGGTIELSLTSTRPPAQHMVRFNSFVTRSSPTPMPKGQLETQTQTSNFIRRVVSSSLKASSLKA
jgi:hypothetical protein